MFGFRVRWIFGRLRQRLRFYFALATVVFLFLFFLERKFASDFTEKDARETSIVDIQKHFDNIGENSVDSKKRFDGVNRISVSSAVGKNYKSAGKERSVNRSNSFNDSNKASSVEIQYKVYSIAVNKTPDNATGEWRTPREKVFVNLMTGQEKAVVFQILQALEAAMAKYGIQYFICAGTLLGSYRHHDVIPWDDDVDVYMNVTERDDIYSMLDTLSPSFFVFSAGDRLKLYSQFSRPTSRYPWKFPYVDINFFVENATHIIDSDPIFDMAYLKETIFPLHRRPLGGLLPYAPFDSYSYLTNTYSDLTYCATTHYDHRTETFIGVGAKYYTPCRNLRNRFPFVYRSLDPQTKDVRETLKIGDTELQSIVLHEPSLTVWDPFKLTLPKRPTRRIGLRK